MLLALLFLTVLLLAYANGANDNFKATATVYGSSTLSYRQALLLATVAQVLGSLASVVLAATLLRVFGGKGLLPDATVANPAFLVAVGMGAATTVLLATRLGMPISTTHALIGGLLGAGLALAPADLSWSGLLQRFLAPLLFSPFIAMALAAIIYPVAHLGRKRLGVEEETCLCVKGEMEPVLVTPDGSVVSQRTGLTLEMDTASECQRLYRGSLIGFSACRIVDALHLLSSLSLGFARGLNDTPKVLGLLLAASWSGIPVKVSLLMVAMVMAFGGLLHSQRIAQTLGKRITELNRGQGLIANLVGSGLVIGASSLGMPVSTTHVSTSAIFGIGCWTGRSRWLVVGEIVLAWLVTLPVAAGIAYLLAVIL
ncbi:MAG: inorganic phosphate transporter [Planctomycetota bacterium]